jgi:hypothetical protein
MLDDIESTRPLHARIYGTGRTAGDAHYARRVRRATTKGTIGKFGTRLRSSSLILTIESLTDLHPQNGMRWVKGRAFGDMTQRKSPTLRTTKPAKEAVLTFSAHEW